MDEYEPSDEELRVFDWRFLKLLELNVPVDDALAIANVPRVDWHRVAQLIEYGCPPDRVARIVL
jgi:hypothetical protein